MKRRIYFIILSFFLISFVAAAAERPEDIFPGQVDPHLIALMIEAKEHALRREYKEAMNVCDRIDQEFPDNPAGPTAKVVLYQVMMLENEDYAYDNELREAAVIAQKRISVFLEKAPKNSWYYTLVGTSWGVQGIYFLRRDEYLKGLSLGLRALSFMQTAVKMDPDDWEARMGLGIYIYYRSAYARFIPIPWLDQRQKGIDEVVAAGRHREYLNEIARIAEYYIYVNEGDYERCKKIMDQLIAERPYLVIYYQFAGRAMFQKGDYKAAIAYYDKQRQIDSSLYLPYFKLGECYYKLAEYDMAKEHFDEFMKRVGQGRSDYKVAAERYLREIENKR